ncbi:carbamoyltransferase C-terminal domain-containing protein [Actinomadura sp. 7K507]|uniref:carbamoyltransferase family protein n=1 Tax=Actinomadura sp. 7K507 TaxID=2530365 RepID=UPI00104522E5|nr:carbamoyltransferase C-terminal domain-containing protein [Actinomadura sp. 7K507]TDC81858.1 carbamoyltransferase [Actinomadura sp. 7K507]
MSGPVLGLCAFTHDSSAALVADGELVGVVEEERLSGIKHDKSYPERGIDWLLREAGLGPGDVAAVALHFQHRLYRKAAPAALAHLLHPATARRAVPRARSMLTVAGNERRRLELLRGRFPHATLHQVLHHRAHGLTAFASSGFDDAAVLVVDSLGETQTTTIARAHRDRRGVASWRIVREFGDPASLGYAYGAVTQHLGWRKADEEGTVMALAALGDPDRFAALFQRAIPLSPGGFTLDPHLFPLRVISSRWRRVTPEFIASTCPPREPGQEITQVHMDLAAALQRRTEEIMTWLARTARDATGARRLCVGGGVAMNCVAIGKILARGVFEEVFVPPAPGDSGTALGAALAVLADRGEAVPARVQGACYLGPTPHAGGAARPRSGVSAVSTPAPATRVAAALAAGKIVGVCAGPAEAGPRALGNRSILASPLLPDVIDRLNRDIKFREPFRPFAPVVLADHAQDFFELGEASSPFMSFAVAGTPRGRCDLPEVFHRNGLARVQTVDAQRNPLLAAILTAFAARTGIPVLINTSLNIKGKPICGTADMALDCLTESGLDGLLLDDHWYTKRTQEPE